MVVNFWERRQGKATQPAQLLGHELGCGSVALLALCHGLLALVLAANQLWVVSFSAVAPLFDVELDVPEVRNRAMKLSLSSVPGSGWTKGTATLKGPFGPRFGDGDGEGWDGMGMGWDGMGWDGMDGDGMGWDGWGWDLEKQRF